MKHRQMEDPECNSTTPERKLLVAIVIRAIADAHSELNIKYHDVNIEYDKKTAQAWLYSASEEAWSFIWICRTLEIDIKSFLLSIQRSLNSKSDNRRGLFFERKL